MIHRSISGCVMSTLALMLGASAAHAQALAAPLHGTSNPACGDFTTAPPNAVCPLILVNHTVRRGNDGYAIARPGFFRPMPLAGIVRGDSARNSALAYEHEARVASWLTFTGQAMLLGAGAVAFSYRCGVHHLHGCSNDPTPYEIGVAALAGGALATLLVEIPIRRSAWQSAADAIWWHNREVEKR